MAAKKYIGLKQILKRLLFDRDMKPIDLARKVNIPPPTIHRIITGKSTRPYKSSLQPIADYFAVTVDQLIGEEPLQNTLAATSIEKNTIDLPLIPWNNIQSVNGLTRTEYKKILFRGNISEQGFATIMPDSSMEPIFARGCLLIFDPLKKPKDRSFILAQLHGTHEPIFRQLLIDFADKYLKPLNPDLNTFKMRLLGKNDKILANLIESRQIFYDSETL